MAIKPVDTVTVDLTRAECNFGGASPAMTRENGVDVPKTKGGVAGLDVDLLVRFPGEVSRSSMKITFYVPVPDIAEFAPVRVHNLRAHVWTARERPGGGMWFSADGIEPVEARPAVKAS